MRRARAAQAELALAAPRAPGFYSSVAHLSERRGWGTRRPLFVALCRYMAGLPPDTPEHLVPMPWVDPAATHETKLVPHCFTPEEDGLVQSWCPPPGAPDFVFNNPPYGDPEEACQGRCKKKVCATRGYHLAQRVPGIEDWVQKQRAEALAWNITVGGLLPHRAGAAWFADMLRPPPEAGRFLSGTAMPGDLAPLHPYRRCSYWAVYRWQALQVEVAVFQGREHFIPEPGTAQKSDSAGFDSAFVLFRGLGPRRFVATAPAPR